MVATTPSAREKTTPAPRRIYHPTQKDYATFLETSASTGGKRTLAELELAPGGGNMPHYHMAFDERFEVLEGELTAVVDREERRLGAGATLEVPRGVVHRMWNPGAGETRALWRTSPAGRTLEWFEALDGLGRRHPPGRAGIPSPTRMAALLSEYDDVIRLSAGPKLLMGALLSGLAAVGRRQGR
jgi:mannose-6-phosphate isomerase-like protein (cupin superfamily)